MNTVGFIPEPNCGRGTVGIIWSCLTTIFLTTWTATHSDIQSTIPRSKRDRWQTSLTSFFLPEVLTASAVDNFIDAYMLRRAIQRIDGWESYSLKQAFLVALDGVYLDHGVSDSESEPLERRRFLDLAHSGRITFNDFPSGAKIDSRTKSDWIAKSVAVLQATWFLATVLSRITQDFTVTPLEDITSASACCGLTAFLLYFRCPQDVQERFPLKLKAEASGYRPPSNGRLLELSGSQVVSLAIVVLAAFSGIHLAAWNYPFPSVVEVWMWRAAVLFTFITGAVTINMRNLVPDHDMLLAMYYTPLGLYIFCRLLTVTLAFAAFRSCPAEVYQRPSWSAYWGHIGS